MSQYCMIFLQYTKKFNNQIKLILPKSIYLKLMTEGQSQYSYCYWDIRSLTDLIVAIVNITIAFAIFIKILFAYFRSKKVLHSGDIFYIYYFLAAWYIAYTTQYLFGVIVFASLEEGQQISIKNSVVFQFMDFTPAFLLLSCLYFSAFNLLKRIHIVCEDRGCRATKRQLNFYILLKKYQFFRLLYITPTLMLLFWSDEYEQQIKICSKVQLGLFLLDSVVCNVCLLVSLRTFRHKSTQFTLSTEEQRIKLKRQSILLQFVGVIRFGMAVIFIVFNDFELFYFFGECPEQNLPRTIIYMVIGQTIMHFLPILVILSIFSISSAELKQIENMDSFITRLEDN